MLKTLIRGAGAGALAWLVYAAAEYADVGMIPLSRWNHTLSHEHWKWTVILLAAYACIGAAAGALAGLCAARRFPHRAGAIWLAATITLPIAYVANLLRASPNRVDIISAAGCVLVCLAAGIGLRKDKSPGWWAYLASPWLAAAVMLVPYRLEGVAPARIPAGLLAVVGALAVVVTSVLLTRFGRLRMLVAGPALLRRNAVLLAIVLTGLTAASLAIDPRQAPPFPDASGKPAPDARNVILIVWDTVRADHLSLHGYRRRTTPELEQLAREAVVYRRAYASGDMTLITHASMFTGMFPSWHVAQSRSGSSGLPRGATTLAEILAARGYQTIGLIGNAGYLARPYRLDQGFAYYDDRSVLPNAGDEHHLRHAIRELLDFFMSTDEIERNMRPGFAITDQALSFLGQAARTAHPFLLFLNYMDAHSPYVCPSPFDQLFPRPQIRLHGSDAHALRREIHALKRPISPAERDHLISGYDGCIAYIDSELSRLIRRLKELNLYENALLIVTSDHGELFGEKNLIGHRNGLAEGIIHVPLVVKYPGTRRGANVTSLASHVDIAPTVLKSVGIPVPAEMQGIDLATLETAPARPILSESYQYTDRVGMHPRFAREERAILLGPMKLIVSTRGKKEMYDVIKDPKELQNLYRPDDPGATALGSLLSGWLMSAGKREASPVTLDKGMLDRMKALGYLQ